MTATRFCFRCETNETTTALCGGCKTAVRTIRTAENAPIWEARRLEAERDKRRSREAWNAMLTRQRLETA